MVQPIQLKERNQLIDILRGFALLGVLMANLQGWVTFALPEKEANLLVSTTADHITEKLLGLLVENKFITIFSLLFGYGFGVITERLTAKGIAVNKFFIRRMAILLLIGLIHIGIWWGEILSTYALCGMLLLLFRKCSNRSLLIWGVVLLFIICPAIQTMKWLLLPEAGVRGDLIMDQYLLAVRSGNLFAIAKCNYSTANFLFIERWSQYRDMAEILAKFIFGYYVLRNNLLTETVIRSNGFKKFSKWVFCIALLFLVQQFTRNYYNYFLQQNLFKITEYIFSRAGILALSVSYVIVITRLYYNNNFHFLFGCFRWVGMMSLSNYLTHTFFFVIIYYGCGLGLLGRLHMQWTIPLALGIYFMQILFCKWWLKHMLYGPVEWVWRQGSYGKWLPLKKNNF